MKFWRQVNHEAEAGGEEKGGRLADLAEELNLTPEQGHADLDGAPFEVRGPPKQRLRAQAG